jgi:hypothetical protein
MSRSACSVVISDGLQQLRRQGGLFLAVVDDVLDRFLAAMTAVVDEVALGESDDLARDLARLGAGVSLLRGTPTRR